MRQRAALCVLAMVACAESREAPQVRDVAGDSFVVEVHSPDACPAATEDPADKLFPPESELRAGQGNAPSRFTVMMAEEISLEEFPLGMLGDGNSARLERARAARIAESQECVLSYLSSTGATYINSLLFINAFVAELTVSQAKDLAERKDIRSVSGPTVNEPP